MVENWKCLINIKIFAGGEGGVEGVNRKKKGSSVILSTLKLIKS